MREYAWFIEAAGQTNESIANFLASEGLAHESEDQIVVKGERKHVWRVPYRVITLLTKSRNYPFKYTVYVREGEGEPRKYTLHERIRRSAKAKKVLAALERFNQK